MYRCKQLLATYRPSFDRAVSGSNYLFGEGVSLIDFIKVLTVFGFCFVFFKFKFKSGHYKLGITQTSPQIDYQVLNDTPSYSF